MGVRPEFEAQARGLIIDAINRDGTLWAHVPRRTVEMIVEAVALDLQHEADKAAGASGAKESQPGLVNRPSTAS